VWGGDRYFFFRGVKQLFFRSEQAASFSKAGWRTSFLWSRGDLRVSMEAWSFSFCLRKTSPAGTGGVFPQLARDVGVLSLFR